MLQSRKKPVNVKVRIDITPEDWHFKNLYQSSRKEIEEAETNEEPCGVMMDEADYEITQEDV